MNFYFQSGEFYNNSDTFSLILNVLGVFLGALLSGLIAIHVFNRGKKEERRKEVSRLEEMRDFFEHTISGLTVPIGKQRNHIAKFVRVLRRKTIEHVEFIYISGFRTDQILAVDLSDLFKIYVLNQRMNSSKFNSLIDKVFLIDEQRESLKNDFIEYNDTFKRFEKEFQKSPESVITNFIEFTSEAQRENRNDEYLLSIQSIILRWNTEDIPEEEKKNPHKIKATLLDPLYTYLDDHQDDRRAPILVKNVREARFALLQIDNLKTYFINHFITFGREIRKNYLEIKCDLQL